MSGVRWTQSALLEARADGLDLSGADLTDSLLVGASLVEAKLMGVNASQASFAGAHLAGANLRERKDTGRPFARTSGDQRRADQTE